MANHCKCKGRCSNCGVVHSWKNCDSPNKRCPNTTCLLCKRELEIVKIKTVYNTMYAEACRKQCSTENKIVPDHSSNDELPPLPVGYGNGVLSQKTQQGHFDNTPTNVMFHSSRKLFKVYIWKPIVVPSISC